MGIKPNLVVGAVGVVVLLVTGTILATNWRTLTDQQTYVATVDIHEASAGDGAGSVAPGSSTRDAFDVARSNVTAFRVRVTWEDLGVTRPQHQVSVTVLGPAGQELGGSSRSGGTAGITIDRSIADVPAPSSFTATSGAAEDEAAERYPPDEEFRGTWTVTVSTSAPTGGGGINYRATLEVSYYTVAVVEEADVLGVK